VNDLVGVLASCLYIFLILFSGEFLRRRGVVSPKGLRKWIHCLVGSWILPSVYLFQHWYWAAFLPFLFIWLNLWGQTRLPLSFDTQEKFGPVYFPISFVILISLLWDGSLRWIACSSLLVMAWADAAASLVGERFGRHPFRLLGAPKSIEGSVTMLVVSFLTCLFVFGLLGRFPIQTALFVSGTVSLVATGVEALCGRGLDNLTVPLSSALVGYLILF